MLKIFNYKNGDLKYHKKIRKKLLCTLDFLPELFWESNPIISGSYAIHLLFKPASVYDDIDIYFSTSKEYLVAQEILKSFTSSNESKNSNTFYIQDLKIQLINKFFATPEDIIYMHDFKNASICITKDSIYIDDELFKLFYDGKLSIRSSQITEEMTILNKLKKIALLFNRVRKYVDRYDLDLDSNSVDLLRDLHTFTKSHSKQTLKKIRVDSNLFYNGTYNPNQNNLRSLYEIVQHMETWLRYVTSDRTEPMDSIEF